MVTGALHEAGAPSVTVMQCNKKASRRRTKRSSKPKDTRTRNWISKVAAEVVDTFREYPQCKSLATQLDFSPKSLMVIDELIETLFGGRFLSKTKVDALVSGFGGYVAYVIQRSNEGAWKKAQYRYTFELVRDGKPTGFAVNPWSWVHKRFIENDLLALKYASLMRIAKQFLKEETRSFVAK